MFEKQACKGAFGSQPHQPIMITEHSQISKVLMIFLEGGKQDDLENPCGTAEKQCTTQLSYGPGQELNWGHLGERRALYTRANHAMISVNSLTMNSFNVFNEYAIKPLLQI